MKCSYCKKEIERCYRCKYKFREGTNILHQSYTSRHFCNNIDCIAKFPIKNHEAKSVHIIQIK